MSTTSANTWHLHPILLLFLMKESVLSKFSPSAWVLNFSPSNIPSLPTIINLFSWTRVCSAFRFALNFLSEFFPVSLLLHYASGTSHLTASLQSQFWKNCLSSLYSLHCFPFTVYSFLQDFSVFFSFGATFVKKISSLHVTKSNRCFPILIWVCGSLTCCFIVLFLIVFFFPWYDFF